MSQLADLEGEFGRAYTERNVVAPAILEDAFRELLSGIEPQTVLEVGCNRGHNLVAVADVLGAEADVVGIEPNRHALEIARMADPRVSALRGNAFALPFRDGWFDLVFTVGVLIHVAPDDLPRALDELLRVSGRYVLAVEYFAEEEEAISYQGRSGLLWKRDFRAAYLEREPRLHVLKSGHLGPERGFDRCHWWLLEKPSSA